MDVVVVARGGGSFEDLLPFSDERLVRAIASCPVPVVTAVGHEQDTPLCDLAADVRASTPDGGGEARRPGRGRARRPARPRPRLPRPLRPSHPRARARARASATTSACGARPRLLLERTAERVDGLHERLRRAPALAVERKRAALTATHGRLAALSPNATLERGYAIVRAARRRS